MPDLRDLLKSATDVLENREIAAYLCLASTTDAFARRLNNVIIALNNGETDPFEWEWQRRARVNAREAIIEGIKAIMRSREDYPPCFTPRYLAHSLPHLLLPSLHLEVD